MSSTRLPSTLLQCGVLAAILLAPAAHGLTRQECKLIGSTIHETGNAGGNPGVWTCCANDNSQCVDCDGESNSSDNCVERPGPVARLLKPNAPLKVPLMPKAAPKSNTSSDQN